MEYRGHIPIPSQNPLDTKTNVERINTAQEDDPSLFELLNLRGPFKSFIQSLTPVQQEWIAHEILAPGLDVTDFEFERDANEVDVITDALHEFVSISERDNRSGLAKEIFRMLSD